jgi:ApbE superfamily uncharacterized protein (UPF0280 family)
MSGTAAAPARARLTGGRWHFQHGPIDLVLETQGEEAACECAMAACWERFQSVLPELVTELKQLRRPAHEGPAVQGPIARRMIEACAPLAGERFITPMASVAGAVADELITGFRERGIRRAYINNGGDIALHLAPGEAFRVGICANLARQHSPQNAPRNGPQYPYDAAARALEGVFELDADSPVRGLATSGWRGRSFSLGIADSVTVLAHSAAAADAAATLIANAVDCDAAGIIRVPAEQLKDDTDLGSRLVTVAVPTLAPEAIARALARGRLEAEYWRERGVIHAAALFLQGAVSCVLQ